MSWDWVPPRPGEEGGTGEGGTGRGPSNGLRRAVTVLIVAFTGVLVVYYATVALSDMRETCISERPSSVSADDVVATWRWIPPGYTCTYLDGGATRA